MSDVFKKEQEDKVLNATEEVVDKTSVKSGKSLEEILEKFDEMVEVVETEPVEKVNPEDCKYQIKAIVQRADLLQNPESATQVIGANTEEEVKQLLQSLNGYKSKLGEIDVEITDQDGNTYQPWDFGMPKPSQYKNRIAQKVAKVIEGEGYRDVYEDLLEFMCIKPFTEWNIIEALDEVFDEDDGPDIPESSQFNGEIAVAIDLVNQNKGTSREAFDNLLNVMIAKRWQSYQIAEALDEVFGEWKPAVATFDVAVYDKKDEAVERAQTEGFMSKEDFLEALKNKDFKDEKRKEEK